MLEVEWNLMVTALLLKSYSNHELPSHLDILMLSRCSAWGHQLPIYSF